MYTRVCKHTQIYIFTHKHIKSPNAKYALFATETQLEPILSHLVLCKLQTVFSAVWFTCLFSCFCGVYSERE